ncbi:MAG: glycosyltransferase family 4 protein [Anaerolineae bacterium]|jgi:glycosyltransferase involved in cell wall biosynthesis
MPREKPRTAIVHYTAPPVVGGVEAVIEAHAKAFTQAGYPAAVVAGRGEAAALPEAVEFIHLPMLDTQHPRVMEANAALIEGRVPSSFESLTDELEETLAPVLEPFDNVIVHNVYTKHFNLPLTAALHRLIGSHAMGHPIAWCHDFSWTSESSRPKLSPGYPWDLLRTQRTATTYVVVSQRRRQALASLFECPEEEIHVVYNGVDPQMLLGLSDAGHALATRLGLLESELNLLMPVRVTQAKNIETALRVVAALKGRGWRPKLVLTGPPDPHDARSMTYFHELQALRADLDVEGDMRFVFESGPDPEAPHFIDIDLVGDLFRVSDVMFMPSHREGFGMPVLEAGLVGIPVVCTPIPAAEEIGGQDVIIIQADDDPDQIADRILDWAEGSARYRLRRRVRQDYTWRAIFHRDIEPLLRYKEDL